MTHGQLGPRISSILPDLTFAFAERSKVLGGGGVIVVRNIYQGV